MRTNLDVNSVYDSEDFNGRLLDTLYYRDNSKNLVLLPIENRDASKKATNILRLEWFLEKGRKEVFNSVVSTIVNSIGVDVETTFDWNFHRFCYFPLDRFEDLRYELIEKSNEFLINFAKKEFKKYLSYQTGRYICVVSDVIESLFELNKNIRYSDLYRRKVIKRMRYLMGRYGNSKSVLLTLTIDPSKFNNDKVRMWMDVKHELNRFLTLVKYHLTKYDRVLPPYLATIEAQKNGNPHIHIVFLNASRLLDWRAIKKYWGLGYVWINRSSAHSKVRNPISYVTKYITKTFCDTNLHNVLTQALTWLFNIRSYSYSKSLGIYPLKYPYSVSSGNKVFLIVDIRKKYNLIDIYYYANSVLQLSAG